MTKIDLIFKKKKLPEFLIQLENVLKILWYEKISPLWADVNLLIS